ncbi:MAG: glycosyltransferase family protein [Bacteroidota bacterium]
MWRTEKKILILVQARVSSSRLPGKVLLPILDKSLLHLMIERLQMVNYNVEIAIITSTQTEDDAIEIESSKIGIYCFRGSLLNLLDRHYQAACFFEADLVVKIPSDCPLIDPKIIEKVFDYYFTNEGQFDYVSNLHPASYPDGNDVEIMTIECLRKVWLEASKPFELEHTTPYIWENPNLFSIGNYFWEAGLNLSMLFRFTIDYQEDYEFIKRVFEELYQENNSFSCEDIINLLNTKPDILQINQKYAGVNWYRNHLNELTTISITDTKLMPTESDLAKYYQ